MSIVCHFLKEFRSHDMAGTLYDRALTRITPIKRVCERKKKKKLGREQQVTMCFRWLCVVTNFYLSVVCRVQRIEKQLTRARSCVRNDALRLPERIKSFDD